MKLYNIPGYENLYKISECGRIFSFFRKNGKLYFKPQTELKYGIDKDGYYKVGLTKDGKQKYYRVHRLVALTFIPNPKNKPYVCHKDNNVKNIHRNNLYWGTQSENITQGWNDGRYEYARKLSSERMIRRQNKPVKQMDLNLNLIKRFNSIKEASVSTGINYGSLSQCLCGRSKTSGGYKWSYEYEG